MKNGKISITKKKTFLSAEDVFGVSNDIPSEVKQEFDKNGWVARWLSIKSLRFNNWLPKKNWKLYKLPNSRPFNLKDGSDPDGMIRKGDLVLAYKTQDEADLHRRYLDQQAQSQATYVKEAAEDMRYEAKSRGLKTKVEEEYDE